MILFLLLPYHFSRVFDKTITYDNMNKKRFALHPRYRDFMEGEDLYIEESFLLL